MQNENKIQDRLEAMESQIFQIKILLLIFMALGLSGLYCLLNSEEIQILIGIGVLVALACIITELKTIYLKKKKLDKEVRKIMNKTKSEQQKSII